MGRTPKLHRINLNKCYKSGEQYLCKGINTKSNYLVKIDNEFYTGTFSIEWYGLCFDGGSIFYGLEDGNFQGIWKIIK
jgi:hypothetical protein